MRRTRRAERLASYRGVNRSERCHGARRCRSKPDTFVTGGYAAATQRSTMSTSNASGSHNRAIVPFFVTTFAITWLLQLPALLVLYGILPGPIDRFMLPVGLGGLGPLLAAVLVLRFEPNRVGIRSLFRPISVGHIGAAWYPLALLLPGVILGVSTVMYWLLGGSGVQWLYPPTNVERIVAMFVFPIGEELGWRGLAMPRMQRRYGSLIASLVIGSIWGLWHVPMFLLAGITASSTLALMLPFCLAGTLVFTWIYNRTRGSLLIAVLMHMGAHLNNSHQALPSNVTPLALHTAAYCIVALLLLLLDRAAWRRPYPPSAVA